jgi:NAD+ kinase
VPDPFGKIALTTWPFAFDSSLDLSALVTWLRKNGFEVILESSAAEAAGEPSGESRESAVQEADLVIVFGGDGSILRTARLLDGNAPPLLGINTGHLGFLADMSTTDIIPALERILLKNEHIIESRMRLRPTAYKNGEPIPLTDVLNDAVLTAGPLARMVEFEIIVDERSVGTFRADGLIVATPTGSTAYSLSAGGPLVLQGLNVMLVNPICPHTLSHRPIVIPSESEVEVVIFPDSEAEDRRILLTLDGQQGCELRPQDSVSIVQSPNPVRLVRPLDTDYFQILRDKLNWESHPRRRQRQS